MLLNLRSLVEAAEGDHVGTVASTGAPATSAALGVVLNPSPPTPVFTGGFGRRHRPEPVLIITGEAHSVGALGVVHARGTVRPSLLLQNVIALAALEFSIEEMPGLLGVDRLPSEAVALA